MFIQDRKFGNLILIINNKNGKGKEKKLIFFTLHFTSIFIGTRKKNRVKKKKKRREEWTEQALDVEL